jgi:hypothetical protein
VLFVASLPPIGSDGYCNYYPPSNFCRTFGTSILASALYNFRCRQKKVETLYHFCTFGELFTYTEGRIANINRVLQNLKRASKEIRFQPECFFMGMYDDETIEILDTFWSEEYKVDGINVFRSSVSIFTNEATVPEKDRKGRTTSYVEEQLETMHAFHCTSCTERAEERERITIRGRVYHDMNCLSCVVCHTSPRRKVDYLTFDGQICCSGTACVR